MDWRRIFVLVTGCLGLLATLALGQDVATPQIVINEIYYDPPDPTSHLE